MSAHHVVVLGAGAAGTAAAGELGKTEGIQATLVGVSGETPYNRTVVNKGVVAGIIEPEQAAMPDPGTRVAADTARAVDADARTVHLASGAAMDFDALIAATGSTPRRLRTDLPGVTDAVTAGRLSTLHSMNDAVRVRDLLARSPHPARVVLLGAGLLAAETSALLRQAGHDIALVARSSDPGRMAFGELVADHVAELHRTHVSTYFARSPKALAVESDQVGLTLDDGTRLEADLVIAALGTAPAAPSPWAGGVEVDDRLRSRDAPRVYAAGGVATHRHDSLGAWRIDHWADAAAQGVHAARTLLRDLGLGPDAGPYLPRSGFSARIYGRTLVGMGYAGPGTAERIVSTDPLLVVHEQGGTPVGVVGLDAGRLLQDWAPRLHTHS